MQAKPQRPYQSAASMQLQRAADVQQQHPTPQPQTQPPPQQQQQQHQHQQHQRPAAVLHERRPGDKVHVCVCCQVPIAVYGRLLPCLHAFCLTCAADMPACYICRAHINRIDRATDSLFISSATLQSFTTEEALAKHTRQLYAHLLQQPQFGAAAAAAAAAAPRGGEVPGGGGYHMQVPRA